MKATLRNSRNGNAKHNDRDFNLEHERNDGHIDPDRQDKNIYWHCYHESEPQLSFYEAEKKYYKEHYNETVKQTNQKADQARHKERRTSIDKMYNTYRTQPEETILQIGNINETVPLAVFEACVREYIQELSQYDEHIHILDWAIHGDEAVPHAHIRKVFDYTDQTGVKRISAKKALELEGFERPEPNKQENVLNNNKITFDQHMRQKWYDICEEHDLIIEREPDFSNTVHEDKETFIQDQQKEAEKQLAITMTQLQQQEEKLLQMQQQMMQLDQEYKDKQEQKKKLEQIMHEDIKEYVKETSHKHVKQVVQEQGIDVHVPHERSRNKSL